MPNPTTKAAALAAGFTRELFASSSDVDLNLLAKPDVDLDGAFLAWDDDGDELIRVNGWLFTIEDTPGFVAGDHDGIMRRI